MKFKPVRVLLVLAGLDVLAFAQSPPNEKAEARQSKQFRVLLLPSPTRRIMAISGGTIALDFGPRLEAPFELQSQDISEIKGDSSKEFQIKLHTGETFKFCVLTQKGRCGAPVGPVVEALSAALSAPAPEPEFALNPPATEGLPIDSGSAVPPRRHFAPIPPPDAHSRVEARLSAPDRQRYTSLPSGGPRVVLTDYQKAALLGPLGRYQEVINIYVSLGNSSSQKIYQDGLNRQLTFWQSQATRGTDRRASAFVDYYESRFSEALSLMEPVIAAGREQLSKGSAYSLAASVLAYNYEFRAKIRFALGDYSGALEDARAAQDELVEAQSLDRDGTNSSNISQYSENFTEDLVIIHLLQREQGPGCALFRDKGIHHSNSVAYPNTVGEICGSSSDPPLTNGIIRL